MTRWDTAQMHRALYRAAGRGTRAPSIHNTQPWQFRIGPGWLQVLADYSRALPVIDPVGRELVLSVGAALMGARLSLAAAGLQTEVKLGPDEASQPELMATLRVTGTVAIDEAARRLDAVAHRRSSNRRQFHPGRLPDDLIEGLSRAAEAEGCWLHLVCDTHERDAITTLAQHAERTQEADPEYRSELQAWTGNEPGRVDGVPASAIRRRSPRSPCRSPGEVPVRDFDSTGSGQLPPPVHAHDYDTLFLLGTTHERRPHDWLAAGQALYRILLELTAAGAVAGIASQLVEVPGTREAARRRLGLPGPVQIMLRAGYALPTPPTPRRPLHEVVVAAGSPAVGGDPRPVAEPPYRADAPRRGSARMDEGKYRRRGVAAGIHLDQAGVN